LDVLVGKTYLEAIRAVLKNGCKFRPKLSTDSGRICPLIPEEVVQ